MYSLLTAEETRAHDVKLAARPRRVERLDKALNRAEPHFAHSGDIEAVADQISKRWFRRAVRFGDELVFLNRLYSVPDPRP